MIRFAGCPYPIHPLAMDLPPLVPEWYARLPALSPTGSCAL